MEFLVFNRLIDSNYQLQVYELLKNCDKEFVPPLSQRISTTQKTFVDSFSAQEATPDSYLQALRGQSVIICVEQDQLLGFMSFRSYHICDDIHDDVPTIYVTTVIVDPVHRGKGLAGCMYQKLIEIALERDIPISTRTWSTNIAHIKILSHLGFHELLRIRNGRGTGIDTVYYRKAVISTA